MKRVFPSMFVAAFLSTADMAIAKDYQVTGPVVDVSESSITVKKGSDNWEIARDKDTRTSGDFKKGDRVTIKYRMTASSIEGKETKSKTDTKGKAETKAKTK